MNGGTLHPPPGNLLGLPDEELPEYSEPDRTPRPLTQHAYRLEKSDRPWLVLNVASRALRPTHIPAFVGFAPISGSVQLDLPKPEYIHAMDIVLKGTIVSRATGSSTSTANTKTKFLSVTQRLWEAPVPTKSPSFMDRMRGREGEPLSGKRDWPFTLSFPERVNFGTDTKKDERRPPPSMIEAGAGVTVLYELEVRVKRAAIAVDNELSTKIAWAPLIRPEPFPFLRHAHYEQGIAQLAAPEDDPEGWTTLPPVSVSGRIFDTRDLTISCTLSLARPLAYTRGSYIPVHLSIKCVDPQALDLLSMPAAPSVKLLELVETRTTAPSGSAKDAKIKQRDGAAFVCESRVVRSAVWWADPAPAVEGSRRLFGEIHFGVEMTPPFDVPDARLYYQVALMPFSAAGFAAPESPHAILGEAHRALATQDVDIVTAYAGTGLGCKPLMVTPPTYAKAEPWPPSTAVAKSGFM